MKYYWQHKNWPDFTYHTKEIEPLLYEYSERVGKISGVMKGLSDQDRMDTMLTIMVSEAIKTSEIEGEFLSRKDVMSSIKNNLGLLKKTEQVYDKKAEGISDLMVDVRNTFSADLTQDQLFRWHQMIMKGSSGIEAGKWRTHKEPMQIVSGPYGKQKVHYEAPPSEKIALEMKQFLEWFNGSASKKENQFHQPIIRAAIAHLYFESIHPFEDGNGRIGRAISEKALSQHSGRPILLTLSTEIEKNKKEYYDQLGSAQRSDDATLWVQYFVNLTLNAEMHAEEMIDFTLQKTQFFDRHNHKLNERQVKVLQRMMEQGPDGFEGGINARKYMSITRTSKATATRDLQDLLEKNIIVSTGGGGRSSSYEIYYG